MNIYIPIEVKARELEGRTLLAFVAAERGHTVVLGEKSDTIGLSKNGRLPPGIVHMKSITPHQPMIQTLSKLHEYGHKVTVQDEENGITDISFEPFGKLRFSEKSLALTDRVFAWGEHDGAGLRNMFNEASEKIVVTGSPRADFWRTDFKNYFKLSFEGKENEFIFKKPYILVVSNFSSFLNVNRFWNVIARLRSAGYFDRDANREIHEYENAAYQTLLIGKFVEMVRELSKLYPNYNIVVRPHPVESQDGWEKIIGEFENVIIERTGTISKWIRHSKLMIYNGSSSAIEAAMSGANRIAYRPLPNDIERVVPNLVGINVFSLEELKKIVSDILEGTELDVLAEVEKITNKYIHDRVSNFEDKLAADRIVDEWESIAAEHSLPHGNYSDLLRFYKSKERKPSLNKKMKKRLIIIRNLLFDYDKKENDSKKLLKNHHKFPSFEEGEIGFIHERLQSLLKRFENIVYKRFGEKSYIITKK